MNYDNVVALSAWVVTWNLREQI